MLNRVRLKPSYVVAIVLVLLSMGLSSAADRPNVILIVTDDQGYGDIGFHGNSMIQTPQLDQLARQSLRFTNFHVDPTCAETRSALMTGKYSCRVGVWHTIMGRSILRSDEKIMPRHFADAGYQTGHFGKWHLGDNWPYRPHDRGFRETLYLGGGGVGQSADHWGNDYFDDTFRRNGNPEPQQGYCTDVFFQAALKFIEAQQHQPFYCYIATNAPHSPYNVDSKYAQPYLDKGVAQPMANFYGMIANIDENIGRLRQKLDEWNLADNTILIFMTDNGTAAGVVNTLNASGRSKKKNPAPKNLEGKWTGYAAGMRAQKGSQYEGGHRVPCYIRWPASKWTHDREIAPLAAHFDLLPTLAETCQLGPIESGTLDGRSLVPLLRGDKQEKETRTIVVHSQRVDFPEKWRKSVVIQGPSN